jgi:E3 ubiquitin-protein ligase TRIP12
LYTEKALSRLKKSKTKAERSAARVVGPDTEPDTPLEVAVPPASVGDQAPVSLPSEDLVLAEILPVDALSQAEAAESTESTEPGAFIVAAASGKSSSSDRIEMFRSKPEVVGRFMRLIIPVLVDIYAASVISTVRIKCLTGLLKSIAFLDEQGLKQVLQVGVHGILISLFLMYFHSLFPSRVLCRPFCRLATTRHSS